MDHNAFGMDSLVWDGLTRDKEIVVVESQSQEREDEDEEPEPLNNVNDLGRDIIKTEENKMNVYTILLVGKRHHLLQR